MDSAPATLQNSLTENVQTGSLPAEIQEAQKATSILHSVISDLESRLSKVTHQYPELAQVAGNLVKDVPEPIRTSLALEAHVVVQDVHAAIARISSLLNNLGL